MTVGIELQRKPNISSDIKLARLGDYVEILSGFAFDSSRFASEGEMPLVRIRDVVRGRTETYYSGPFEERFVVRKGDLLVGMDGDFNRETWSSEPALLNQRVCRISPDDVYLDRRYLYHFLPQALMEIWHATPFATVKHLSIKAIREITLPLPPLKEQRRIAAILDKADELRSKRRQALAQLDTLTQSVFHNMFRDAENLSSLGEYVDFRYGTSNKSGATGIATLRIPNIVSGSIDLTDLKVVSVSKEEEERLVLRNGDLLFVRSNGNPANVGRCAVFDTSRMQLGDADPRDFIYASYLIRARMRKPGLSSMFLQTYLSSAEGRAQLLAGAKTSAGQYNINTQALRNLKVPIVSLERQTRFEKSVSDIELLGDRYTTQLAELDALFSVLQHRAFRGEL